MSEANNYSQSGAKVGVAPLHRDGDLCGFLVSGRWPDSTVEWSYLLLLAVRIASIPGLLRTTTVFDAREDSPEGGPADAIGIVLAEGPLIGADAVDPESFARGRFAEHLPPALMLLHPPSETSPSLPECGTVGSGCVLLPGLPHLGLEHRAAWVEAEPDGTVTSMRSTVGLDPMSNPDTAVLSMFLAA